MRDFLKVAWVNEEMRSYWNYIIKEFQQVYSELEFSSIGLTRQAGILSVLPENLATLSQKITDMGWSHVVLSHAPNRQGYSNKTEAVVGNEPIIFRVLVSTKPILNYKNDKVLGRYLGYPFCCINDFSNWWGKIEDPTHRMFYEGRKQFIPSIASVLYRHLGLRFVRHLPCTPSCRESIKLAEGMFREIANRKPSVAIAVYKLISSSAKWDRLHGVAEVTNDVVKFAYKTDYTPTKESFALKGDYMVKFNSYEWKDNGFSSYEAMERAHDPIIIAFLHGMRESKSPAPKVIDYGCGNAALLEKLHILEPSSHVFGVELNEPALRKAEERLPMGRFALGDLYTKFFPDTFDFSLVSVARLFEVEKQKAVDFIKHLKHTSTYTIFYDYDKGGIITDQIRKKLGMDVRPHIFNVNNACEALLVRW